MRPKTGVSFSERFTSRRVSPIPKPLDAGWACAIGFADAHPLKPDAQAHGSMPAANSAPHHVRCPREDVGCVRAKEPAALFDLKGRWRDG